MDFQTRPKSTASFHEDGTTSVRHGFHNPCLTLSLVRPGGADLGSKKRASSCHIFSVKSRVSK